jgi:hypothetical protein
MDDTKDRERSYTSGRGAIQDSFNSQSKKARLGDIPRRSPLGSVMARTLQNQRKSWIGILMVKRLDIDFEILSHDTIIRRQTS